MPALLSARGGSYAREGSDLEPWLASIAREVEGLDRSSTAERIADVLRSRITEGDLPPGTRMSEVQLGAALGVSRNTLRESFRLLAHEGLLVHVLHRGVFVPELSEVELRDLYQLRRTVECAVVRALSQSVSQTHPDAYSTRLDVLARDVADAEDAAGSGDWVGVGTANMKFHEHLVALAGNRRMDEIARRLLAELRLAFHVVASPRDLHESYIERNRTLLGMLRAGRFEEAAAELEAYLHSSEAALLAAHRNRRTS